MSIFGSIMERVFHHPSAAPAVETGPATPAGAAPASAKAAEASLAATAAPTAQSAAKVDVGEVLAKMDEANGQHLNYKSSIVDLLKLLDLDSSLEARHTLAKELDFPGDPSNTAVMNTWLHKAVIAKLEENGGVVPLSLKEA